MDHIDRFYATVDRKAVDRPCSFLGMPTQGVLSNLFTYFEVNTGNESPSS